MNENQREAAIGIAHEEEPEYPRASRTKFRLGPVSLRIGMISLGERERAGCSAAPSSTIKSHAIDPYPSAPSAFSRRRSHSGRFPL